MINTFNLAMMFTMNDSTHSCELEINIEIRQTNHIFSVALKFVKKDEARILQKTFYNSDDCLNYWPLIM